MFIILAFPNARGHSLYAYDEHIRDLNITQNISLKNLVLLGPPSSLGSFYFGPAYYYLLFPFVRLTNSALWSLPLASIFYTSLTIVVLFFVVKKWWQNTELALLISGLMSASILTTQFAMYSSNPNTAPLFSLLFFYFLERLVGGTSRPVFYTFLLSLSFGIAIQLHSVPLVCLPIILFILILTKKLKFNPKLLFIFVVGVLLTNSPYIYYDLTHNFANTKSLFQIAAGANNYAPLSEHVVGYIGFWITSFLSSHPFFNVPLILGNEFYIYFIGLLISLFLVFKYNVKRLRPAVVMLRTQPSVRLILKFWLLVPTVVLLLPAGALAGLRIYYYFILSPLVFIFLGLGLWNMYKNGYYLLVYCILAAYFIMQAGQMYLYHMLISQLK
ncbi:MAG: hypothetical protein HY918_00060 [Candidatus Doudnabacteria bacterium]|nr:hypothetical protein [Candidatus Doudnabacteria bacterium]